MADQQNTSGVQTNSFTKGLLKDINETYVGEGFWSHARNAVNNSHDGQTGVLGNEPSTLSCVTLPYDLIGNIHLYEDKWLVFTTNDIDSEIGIFDESECSYTKVVNDRCLNFNRNNLVTGTYRKRYDCGRIAYFADNGRNPDRAINLDNVPFKYKEKYVDGCLQKTLLSPLQLDCEKLRLSSHVTHPCLNLSKGTGAGSLSNGSYQVTVAYTVNKVKISDYIGLSEVQSLFSHNNTGNSLKVDISKIDTDFEEFELVLLSNINSQTTAKRIGYYSTAIGSVYIDRLDSESVSVPISDIVFRTSPIEKSDAMYSVNNYLLRVGPYYKYKFNYQPQANKIRANWNAVQYPANYYIKGGNNTGYMRDEQYSFFIRWIHNTGERTESYHIPGRAPSSKETKNFVGGDNFENKDGVQRKLWQIRNTASINSIASSTLSDGGIIIASGKMGYWESTEKYSDKNPEIWGNLCGQPIRHHKFPDETIDPILSTFNSNGNNIVLLGVSFDNITTPLDENGIPIESIVGYEILRGSREGNKTIVGKGIINNMRVYNDDTYGTGDVDKPLQGLYVNYPYNDLREDLYLTPEMQTGENGKVKVSSPTLKEYKKNIFSFHSPETTFNNPYLNANELKLYQTYYGTSNGRFVEPYKHPKFKQITNGLDITLSVFAVAFSVARAASAALGSYSLAFGSKDGKTEGVKAGVEKILGEGTLGAFSDVALPIAVGVNIALEAAQNLFLGTKKVKQDILDTVLALIPKRQYAAQYNSYGFYNKTKQISVEETRKKVIASNYIDSQIENFANNYYINNSFRSRTVVIQTDSDVIDPEILDDSRTTIGKAKTSIGKNVTTAISSHYGALKIPMESQYGQLESIKQIPISPCNFSITPTKEFVGNTDVLFGGDVYINRFTEKNTMYFFNSWLMGEPDEVEFNYAQYSNIMYPRFWLNNTEKLGSMLSLVSSQRSFDYTDFDKNGFFYLKRGHFYLFNSGVRDFFVESEVNVAYRDWEDELGKRHYDYNSFINIDLMFRSDIIKSGNFYKYDYSLSASKLLNNHISWGSMLPRDYDPNIASKCYTYAPNRVLYSLPQQEQSKKDNWRVFLPNNFKDFNTRLTAVKSINKTGALFMMYNQSPLSFMGVEELKLDGTSTKITIGDGALFSGSQQLQQIVNVDDSYEYASNQSKYACVNTPYGLFWVSQNQGKVFNYTGSINDISKDGMKWWFAKYLPSELLKSFPDYPHYDNPISGVGVNMVYDNTNDIIYITKKDYKPKLDLLYDSTVNKFYILRGFNRKLYYELTDPIAFEEVSWTISYDPKNKVWISFHDWHPNWLLPGKNHFMSVTNKTIWKHNLRCDSFCNFYGVDYPFEVEFISSTGQQVNSVRNIEYMLEAYKYHNDCRDKFHILDENFDQAIIYNSEQISGVLNLHIKPKNNPVKLLQYPIIKSDSIDIIYSKEENKYRFNQFYDATRNRGEFIDRDVSMFLTKGNGYEYSINPLYVNYTKSPLQHKKFRHYTNRVFLRKQVSNNIKLLFKISNQKTLQSPR